VEQLVNLSEVCERYGGGGHARVGAISFGAEDGEKGRVVAEEIVAELRAVERARIAS
jgi:nanoRNase/pAp phosphatase (c-di-AMP/oligoRNAs hydrolase)